MCVECRYKHKCTSYPDKCDNCANNFGKRDYFKPDYDPWYPGTRPWPWHWDSDYINDNDARWDFFTSIKVS